MFVQGTKLEEQFMYNYSSSISANTSKTYNIENSSRLRLIGTSSSSARMFDYIIVTTQAGAVNVAEVYKGQTASYTVGTGTITITSTGSGTLIFGQIFMGEISEQ